MKILIVKPSSLGDVVQALPVLRLLKLHWPNSEIDWCIDSALAPLLEDDPDLACVALFERRRWVSPRCWPELWRCVRHLRARSYDLVIDLQGLARSGILSWLANGKVLVGLDSSREGSRGFYDVIVPRASFHTHAVDWYLAVLERLNVPVHCGFTWLPERPAVAAELQRKWPAKNGRWIAVQPGARWPNKRWPVEYYAELVRLLAVARPEFRLAILGDQADRELGSRIAAADPERCLDLTGRLSLPEMVEWLRLSELMISNDTGPMHVAAALGKPVVAIFGPTEPRRTGPYKGLDGVLQAELPCIPCMKARCTWRKPLECLHRIQPAVVLREAERLLVKARDPGE